jgi:hypothetical protein
MDGERVVTLRYMGGTGVYVTKEGEERWRDEMRCIVGETGEVVLSIYSVLRAMPQAMSAQVHFVQLSTLWRRRRLFQASG